MVKKNLRQALTVLIAILLLTTPVSGAVSFANDSSPSDDISSAQVNPDQTQFQAESVNARILNFNQQSGEFEVGDQVTAEVEIRNTGDSEHTFFVGYSVEGPDGEFYDNGDQTGKTIALEPNEREWVSVSWTAEKDAPTGDYDAVTSVWKESDRDNLQTRLDNERRNNAFEVVEPTEIDAQVTSFSVENGEFKQEESVDATATIENTGNTEHTFFLGYSVFGPNGNDYDNNDETGQTVTLDPGEQEPVSLEWIVEADAPTGDYDAVTSVWKESDRDNLQTRLDNERRNNAFEVVEPTEIDAQITDFSVENGEFTQDESVDATATVENTGNTEHTFFIGYSVVAPNGEFYDNDDETGQTVTLDPGESRRVSLSWSVQSNSPTGRYDAVTSVWQESDRDNLNTRLDRTHRNEAFEIVEPTKISARLTNLDVENGEFTQDESIDTTATIENTGNTEHTFFVGYSVVAPNGEFYDNNDETGRTVTLDPDESRRVSLSWSVQSDSPTGRYDAVTSAWQESDRDNLNTRLDRTHRNEAFEVVEPTEINAQLTGFDVENGEFTQGESVDATAIVTNTGNTKHTFFIGYSAVSPSGDDYDNGDETGRTVALDPGESRRVSLSWSVQSDSPTGDYDALTSVWRESDRDNLDTRLDRIQRDGAFEVVEPTEINAQVTGFDVKNGEFTQDESVDATATIENTGNTEHIFFVGYSVVAPNGEFYDNNDETGQTVALDPGESRRVSLSWSVQSDSPTGRYDAVTSIWQESDQDNLNTRLDRVRRGDAFEVVEPTEVDARVTGFDVESGEFAQDESVDATATVENTGNTEHTFFIGYSAIGPDSDYYDNNNDTGQTVRLAPGDSRSVSLSWNVQSESPTGEYGALISVWKESDRDNLNTRLDRIQRDGAFEVVKPTEISAQVTNLDIEGGEFKPGESIDATTTVENTGNTEHTFFIGYSTVAPNGKFYDNNDETGQTVTLDPGESRRVSLSWSVQSDSPTGRYDAVTSVWQESDRDDLDTRLDRTQRDGAFEIVEPAEINARVTGFDVESGKFTQDESVDATATVRNTGNTEHTFFVGYSAVGPNGEYHDNNNQTGQAVRLDSDESRTISLSWTVQSGSPTGRYDTLTSVWKESDHNDLTTRLDRTQHDDAFKVVESTEINARVTNFDIEGGEFEQGESVDATAVVENTGNTEHTFFIGYSAIGPDNEYYDNNDETGQTITLTPGDSERVSLSWTVQGESPTGEYGAFASIWKESGRQNLNTRLDRVRRGDAFEVVEPTEVSARLSGFDVENGEFTQGESVNATATIENTGNTTHTFFIGYSVFGPDDNDYDNADETSQTVTLNSGESQTVSLSWNVQSDSPTGEYGAFASIWKESDRDSLNTQLSKVQRGDAFKVVESTEINAQVAEFDVESGEFSQGNKLEATVVIENTGTTEHTFSVGYSAVGPNGDVYNNSGETVQTISLAPDESDTLSLSWTIGEDVPEGIYDAQATVWQESSHANPRLDEIRRDEVFQVVATTGTVTGVVLDSSGEPLSDATVGIDSESTTTDNRGQFTLSDIPSGEHTIVATAPGYNQTTVSVTLESGQVSEPISLSPNPASISNLHPPASYHPGETVEVGMTIRPDGDGTATYEVAIPPQDGVEVISENSREVSIPAGIAAKTIYFQVQFIESRESQSISAELRAPGSGQVLDSASGTTTATQTSLTVQAVTERGEPVVDAEFELVAAGRPSQTTDASGSVTFRGLTEGEYVLLGSDDTRDAYPSKEVTVTADDQNTVRVRFPAKARVEGKVTADGEPLSGASISIGGESQRVTEEGEFRIGSEFQTGRHELTVKHRGEVVLREQVDLHAGRNSYDLTVDPIALDAAETKSGDVEEVDRTELMASVDEGTVMAGMGTTSDSIWYNIGSSGEFWSNRDGSYHMSGPCAFYNDNPTDSNEFRQEFCGSDRPADDETHPAVMRDGSYRGFATGLGESVESVKQTIKSARYPIETAQAFTSFVFKIANDLGLFEELISALPESVKEQQRDDNDYPANSSEYRSFRAGWYGGYGGYQVVTVVASAGAGKVISTSSRLSRTASKFDSFSREKKKQLLRRGSATRQLTDHGLSDDTVDRLADLKRSGDLDTSDLNRLENALDNGEIDTTEVRRVSKVLDESESFRYDNDVSIEKLRYDNDVSIEELIESADNDDLSDTVAVIKPADTVTKDGRTVDMVQLDTGDADTGREHLLLRHVRGAERMERPITNFWPVGQTVGGRTLPDAMDIDDIDRLTYRAIKNGDVSDTGTEITYRYDDVDVEGIDEVIVKVDEQTGRVISSYPGRSGSAVDTYYGSADEWNIESE